MMCVAIQQLSDRRLKVFKSSLVRTKCIKQTIVGHNIIKLQSKLHLYLFFLLSTTDGLNRCAVSFWSDAHKFRAAYLASRLLSSRCSACCAPPAAHKPCIIQGSGRKLCCWRRLFIAHKRLCLKTPNATQSAPLSSPSCVSSKGPPVSSTWKCEGGKQSAAALKHPARLSLPLMTGLFKPWIWRVVPCVSMEASESFFHVWKINFVVRLVVWVFFQLPLVSLPQPLLRLLSFRNILSVNAEWDKQAQGKKSGLKGHDIKNLQGDFIFCEGRLQDFGTRFVICGEEKYQLLLAWQKDNKQDNIRASSGSISLFEETLQLTFFELRLCFAWNCWLVNLGELSKQIQALLVNKMNPSGKK